MSHPYLAYAATIAAGLHGIANGIEPPPGFAGNAYEAADVPRLPTTLVEAIDAFAASAVAREAFGHAPQSRARAFKGPQDYVLESDAEVERFFGSLHQFDDLLGSDQPLGCSAERLFQGPIADAFTHVGQLAMLRGLAGERVRAENYFGADVAVGRVGADQTPPKREW